MKTMRQVFLAAAVTALICLGANLRAQVPAADAAGKHQAVHATQGRRERADELFDLIAKHRDGFRGADVAIFSQVCARLLGCLIGGSSERSTSSLSR